VRMVAIGTVDMLVGLVKTGGGLRDLRVRRFADLSDFDVVPQCHPRQRMVGVHRYAIAVDRLHTHGHLVAVGRLRRELVSDLNAFRIGQLGPRDLEHEAFVVFPVRTFDGDDDFPLISYPKANQCRFEPRDQHAVAMNVPNGLSVRWVAGIEDLIILVTQLVFERNVRVGSYDEVAHFTRTRSAAAA
jgi:hypothetical protein